MGRVYNERMRDGAVRTEAGISLRGAARALGVSDNTLRLYEACGPLSVVCEARRARIARYYDALRAFLATIAA